MERGIVDFHQDEEGHWVADLSCGHTQHVRHKPPLISRPWVLTEEGRRARLGELLDCVLCDERVIPAGSEIVRLSKRFTEETIPKGLLNTHRTPENLWARIEVTEGKLRFCLHAPYNETQLVDASHPAVILPGVDHHLELLGPVAFFIEFLKPIGSINGGTGG